MSNMTDLWRSGVVFKLQMHKNSFSAGAPPQTTLGSLRRSPRPLVGRGGGHPLPIPFPSTFGVSISIGASVVSPQHKYLATMATPMEIGKCS